MAMKNKNKKGFALLVSVIFMSVMLTLGLALSSLGYKQEVLASTAIRSQYAFYAADAGLECALYADQQQNLFEYPPSDPSSAPAMTCDGSVPFSAVKVWSESRWIVTNRLSLDADAHCVDVTIYKYNDSQQATYIFSQGYDVSCSNVAPGGRFVSRGIYSHY
ncbi:hypothetical protein A2609_01040 [Candidatus Kaiserbacteria bacterium RIFOXYD1_FULL_47_14]|uniref:Type 4 fimbrial biogenesis protein PilX N-terminal domain-containing protein n=1 Tax=Candidatus Kaiserbacteria bacterium RIFOXYD1_FULL_47_14 TaxID=1798533 RepID=A0A1F6G6U6_9BACT|nr:MAG: hypothetical protein A2609_01040 [Candidatus Kaiserbacteria bacterium RIFOXYD1_FULL_47_14]